MSLLLAGAPGPAREVRCRPRSRRNDRTQDRRLGLIYSWTWPNVWLDLWTHLFTSLGDLLSTRLHLLRDMACSLELSQIALTGNNAEMIARGAARQAELCRQWSLLEDQLRRQSKLSSGTVASRTSEASSSSCSMNRNLKSSPRAFVT